MKTLISIILLISSVSFAVTDFQLDGITTPVKQSTTAPTNSRPLPISYLNVGGVRTDLATEATLLGVDTTLTEMQTTLGFMEIDLETIQIILTESANGTNPLSVISESVVNTGTFAQITNLVSTAQTFTAPANAVGFKIQAPSTNTENIAFSIGATATITAGIVMEPGRSEDFDVGSNISVIATSATQQRVTVIWKVKP